MNYQQRIEKLKFRNDPDNISEIRKSKTSGYSDVFNYVENCMKPVDKKYTTRSMDAGINVISHIEQNIDSKIDFQFQGSITTDSHIKAHSDIDILAMPNYFYVCNDLTPDLHSYPTFSVQSNLIKAALNAPIFKGNRLEHLKDLRLGCESILLSKYEDCQIDRPKSIKILNKHLNRFVDLVIANYYDDLRSVLHEKGEYRGIQIFNKDLYCVEPVDFPFLRTKLHRLRNKETKGSFNKVVRFLKNLKSDSETEILISSYQISSLCYSINIVDYFLKDDHELVEVIFNFITKVCSNLNTIQAINSIDGQPKVFSDYNDLINLRLLKGEIEKVFKDMLLSYNYKVAI